MFSLCFCVLDSFCRESRTCHCRLSGSRPVNCRNFLSDFQILSCLPSSSHNSFVVESGGEMPTIECKTLTSLHVWSSNTPKYFLSELPILPKLESLEVVCWDDFHDSLFAGIADCASLKRLEFSGSGMPEIASLRGSKCAESLRTLIL